MQYGFFQPFINPFGFFNSPYNFSLSKQQTPVSVFNKREHTTYNEAKGDLLIQNALRGLPSKNPDPPMCAKYVKNAVVNSGLGRYEQGNGEQAKYMFRNNLNFMEVKVKGSELQNLPKGTAIVYDAKDYVSTPEGKHFQIGENGHVLLKDEGNKGYSDRFESFIPQSDRAYAFIPV